jgi:hypothetical protein
MIEIYYERTVGPGPNQTKPQFFLTIDQGYEDGDDADLADEICTALADEFGVDAFWHTPGSEE